MARPKPHAIGNPICLELFVSPRSEKPYTFNVLDGPETLVSGFGKTIPVAARDALAVLTSQLVNLHKEFITAGFLPKDEPLPDLKDLAGYLDGLQLRNGPDQDA